MKRLALIILRIIGVLGASLFILHLSRYLVSASVPASPSGNHPTIPGYHTRIITPQTASDQLQKLYRDKHANAEQLVHRVFEIVSEGFAHGDKLLLKPSDNWLLWTMAVITTDPVRKERYLDVQDPEVLLRRGVGFCHQASWLLVYHLRNLGLKAVLARLDGHYVTQVWIPGGGIWTLDPDLGITWKVPLSEFGKDLSDSEIREAVIAKGFSSAMADELVAIYTSQENNSLRAFYDREALELQVQTRELSYYIPLGMIVVWLLGEMFFKRIYRISI